jgi:hypothetical protein
MIDFDVITGPGPAEKPREPAPKPPPARPADEAAASATRPLPDEALAPARTSPAVHHR